jgi:Werner syndrome ATP-dependent helicase
MDIGNIVFAIIGFSASFIFCAPNLKRWHRKQVTLEKLKIIREALEEAEERVVRFQERHDRILNHISASYLTNTEVVEALAGARQNMNQSLDFAVQLRSIQFKTISSFPDTIHMANGTINTQSISIGSTRGA